MCKWCAKAYSGSGVASLTYCFHRFCHHLHPLNTLQSPPSTPLHPTYPHQSLPQIPPKSTNIIILYLPPVRPSVFPATIILHHYLQLTNVFSYLPSRNYPYFHHRLPQRLSTLIQYFSPAPVHARVNINGSRGIFESTGHKSNNERFQFRRNGRDRHAIFNSTNLANNNCYEADM
jgi:hypothetical protein